MRIKAYLKKIQTVKQKQDYNTFIHDQLIKQFININIYSINYLLFIDTINKYNFN